MPPELFNRTGDNWRGLFIIAEAAGGEWPELRPAGGEGGVRRGGQSIALQLLEAIWQVFAEKKVVRLHTKALLPALLSVEESPWEKANNGRAIDAYWLRDELAGFSAAAGGSRRGIGVKRARQWRERQRKPPQGIYEDHLHEALVEVPSAADAESKPRSDRRGAD